MKSIDNYSLEEQQVICDNLYSSNDMERWKYGNVYNDAVKNINGVIKKYSSYGHIYPSNVKIKNDGVVYSASLSNDLFITYIDDGVEKEIVATISSMGTRIEYGLEGGHVFGNSEQYADTGITDEGYVEYFSDLPKWINELIGEITWYLGWFEIDVEDGLYGEPYDFEDFLYFLEAHEKAYGIDIDYTKYL